MKQEGKYKFALVGHSPELARMVRQSFNPNTEDILTKVVGLDEAVPVAKQLIKKGAEVILGHGGTGRLILQVLGQQVVRIPRTEFDIITAFLQAKRYGKKIGFTSFARETDGINLLEKLLDIEVNQLIFVNKYELEREVYSAFSNGIKVVVGGGVSRDIMMDLGGKGVVILPRESIVREALKEARAIASARREEVENAERIRTILQMIDEGVISVDCNGRIEIYNEKAQEILGESFFTSEDKMHSFFANKLNIIDILSGEISEIDTISKVRGKDMFINTMPVKVNQKIRGAVAFIREVERFENINRKLRENLYAKGFVATHQLVDIKGKGSKIKAMLEKASKYAVTDATILIQGQTGTGKGLLAEAIHNISSRKKEPFVAVNCPALPEALLESELFGYEEGAFTGAKRGGKVGLFEMANKGTIFLDEIADIPHSVQVRLLRVVEAKEVMRVGGDRYVPVDVRIISSSNKDLRHEVKNGRFREDLFYRLAFLKLKVPSLKERIDDIPYIIQDIIDKYEGDIKSNCKKMIDMMGKYSWPGNIRELRSFVESYFILLNHSKDKGMNIFNDLYREYVPSRMEGKIDISGIHEHLETEGKYASSDINFKASLKTQLDEYEKMIINRALEDCNYKKKEAAKLLGISLNTLWRKLKM